MHYLYILYSQKLNRFYTGETSDLQARLEMHNTHHFKKAFTKPADDWTLKLIFETNTRNEAKQL
ncbi:GIY-YIG nuclease family protein [Christiangramia sabulilitoris]|uniref:GIY-YIG domain-containing protein n=1 Tax=Christiangramia sabulilitoris TaxID=2583991 RepID=A0A550I7Y8_9FLAO|nr:GIY-YIG nuclease family protein [Christiangramia sabulilitoris]TRO67092.1 hypothetical protein FGM01_04180 [Christiangramia sabulilitoris]